MLAWFAARLADDSPFGLLLGSLTMLGSARHFTDDPRLSSPLC
jgi:hypothetical protein